jgi:hypothetical protein
MKTPLAVALVSVVALTAQRASAIPNCPPGYQVQPAVDQNGQPVPGGDCVPIGAAASAPIPSTTTKPAPKQAAKPTETSARGCTFGTGAPTAFSFVTLACLAALSLRRRSRLDQSRELTE